MLMRMKKWQLSYMLYFAFILLLPLKAFAAPPVDAGAGETQTIAAGESIENTEGLVPGAHAHDGGKITIESGAAIHTDAAFSDAVMAEGGTSRNAATITMSGNNTVSTSGDASAGVKAVGNKTKIQTSSLTVNTSGNESHGLVALDGGWIRTATTNVKVATTGAGSHAAYADGTKSLIDVDVNLSTTGEGSHAAYAHNGGGVNISYGPVISTTGNNANAVFAEGAGSRVYGQSGANITTSGDNSLGFAASDGGSATLTINTRITTKGANSHAISSTGADSLVSIGNNAKIATSGAGAYGVLAEDGGTVQLGQNITVSTSGAGAHGAEVTGGSNVTVGSVDIKTSGEGANGLLASGENSAITVTDGGNISVSGAGSYGVSVNDGAVANLNVNVSSTGSSGGAIAAEGGTVNITGNVSAAGNNTYGVNAAGGSEVNVTGDVVAQGKKASGVLGPYYGQATGVRSDASNVTIGGTVYASIDTAVNPSTVSAVEAVNNGTVNVRGDIEAEGALSFRGAMASSGGTVNVSGDINIANVLASSAQAHSDYFGAQADGADSVVNVDGSISAEMVNSGGVLATNGGTVNVKEDITSDGLSSQAIAVRTDGTVNVAGNVESTGIVAYAVNVRGGTVNISGDVKAIGDSSTYVSSPGVTSKAPYGGVWATSDSVANDINIDGSIILSTDANASVYDESYIRGIFQIVHDPSITMDGFGVYLTNGSVKVGGGIQADGNYLTGALVSGDNSIADVAGNISMAGDSSIGAHAYKDGEIRVGGGINMAGSGTIGALADDPAVITVGYISMDGYNSVGAYSSDDSVINVTKYITVLGDKSTGAYAYDKGKINVGDYIKVEGEFTFGLQIKENSAAKVINNVEAYGNYTKGVFADANSSIDIGGNVIAEGAGANGIDINKGSSADITGSVRVNGQESVGANAFNNGNINIGGSVVAEGMGATGMKIVNMSSATVANGVEAYGNYTKGVYTGTYSSVDIVGNVRAEGSQAYGLDINESSSADISGGVWVSGDHSVGAHAFDKGNINIDDFVSVEGENSTGLRIVDSSAANVANYVYVSGDVVTGAFTRNNSSLGIGGNVLVSGDNSTGLYSDQNANIYVRGDYVTVYGEDSTALKVDLNGNISFDNTLVWAESLSLIKTDSGGSVNAENGSYLNGNVTNQNISFAGEELYINLKDGSSLEGTVNDIGAEAVTSMTISGINDVWRVTGGSAIKGTLTNSGMVDFTGSSGYTNVTVGDLSGGTASSPGLFVMKTDVAQELADTLTVTGNTSGSYKIDVQNDHSSGFGVTGLEKIPLVYTADQGGTFSLTHGVDVGMYTYRLNRNTVDYTGWGTVWELVTTDMPSAVPSGAANTFSGAYLLSYAETNTLIRRLGDLRMSPALSGLWFRAHGGKFESNSRSYVKEFDMDYGGVQLGYDRKVEIGWDGDFYAGVMFGYSKGDLDYLEDGNGGVDSKMLGIYGTFTKPNGFYLDAILKYQWMNNEFDVLDAAGTRVTGDDLNTGGFGWSVEVGQKIHFKGDGQTGWYASPQVQLSYMRQDGGYFNANDGGYGLTVGVEPFTSLLGRLGLQIGYETENKNFYAVVSRVREFDGDVTIIGNGVPVEDSFGGSWWVYGLGYTSKLSDRNSIYVDIERSSGGPFTQPWRINAGWRTEF